MDPRKVPHTAKGRAELEQATEAAIASGDFYLAGLCLTELGSIYKHVGTATGRDSWTCAYGAATKAVEYLRQYDDKGALGLALLVLANVPFIKDFDYPACIEESIALCQEAGDEAAATWGLFTQVRNDFLKQELGLSAILERKRDIYARFERLGNKGGQAACLQSIATQLEGREQFQAFMKAGDLYESTGRPEDAARAYHMGLMFGRKLMLPKTRHLRLLRKMYRAYASSGSRQLAAQVTRRIARLQARRRRS